MINMSDVKNNRGKMPEIDMQSVKISEGKCHRQLLGVKQKHVTLVNNLKSLKLILLILFAVKIAEYYTILLGVFGGGGGGSRADCEKMCQNRERKKCVKIAKNGGKGYPNRYDQS